MATDLVEVNAKPVSRLDEKQLKLAQKGSSMLESLKDEEIVKLTRARWESQDEEYNGKLAHLKVNYLRYEGVPFVQVHPDDSTRVWLPRLTRNYRTPPVQNKIERAVDHYVAQVTADEPYMEALPANHTDRERDAAEAATQALEGETERMRLMNELRRAMYFASVLRSGFWFFEWDSFGDGTVPAQMYVDVDDPKSGTMKKELRHVGGEGQPVENAELAAQVPQGQLKVSTLNPLHVRYAGARYAHRSDEVMVAKLVRLRTIFETYPETRKAKLEELFAGVPGDAEAWLSDDSEETFRSQDPMEDEVLAKKGEDLEEDDSILDRKCFLLNYYRKPNPNDKKGVHVLTVGKVLIAKGGLRWGVIPIAHFKCLESLKDKLGRSVVDLLKDPQELLDFINSQVIRFLQTLRRRWFVPEGSNVSVENLLNPTLAAIPYNPAAGKPEPEVHAEVPNSLFTWVEQFSDDFDDQAGIHDTMRGKHVPGVTSGRHAEALRTGDETVLGLTRQQIEEGLVAGYSIILKAIRKEWKLPRRVRYWGEDRQYMDKHFASADFSDTADVILKKGTLLMLTPAQKTELMFGYAEMGVVGPQELRRLAPLTDTAGISLTESPHYIKARRENERFLEGPPQELVAMFQKIQQAAQQMQERLPQLGEQGLTQATMLAQQLEQQWQQALMPHAFTLEPWEQAQALAMIHWEEHARALARKQVENFPEWWVALLRMHAHEAAVFAGLVTPPGLTAPQAGSDGQGGVQDRPGGAETPGTQQPQQMMIPEQGSALPPA
jgi:hypothetical protein